MEGKTGGKKKYVFAVLGAGFCWGFMGFFTRNLAEFGINSSSAVLARCFVAAVGFAVVMLIRDPSQFKIKPKDIWCFLGTGIVSLLFFTYCYFRAIAITSLSTAAILLYTAPSIVMILSAFLFRERITWTKLAALVLAFLGCAFVSGLAEGALNVSGEGLIFGLCSGVGYAFYSIFARFALKRGYTSTTINFYSCLLASVGAALIWGVSPTWVPMTASFTSFAWCAVAGILTCFLPYTLYTYGLSGLDTGKASVIASIEPVVASISGVVIFNETMSVWGIVGIILVLTAVVLLNIGGKKNRKQGL